MAFRRTPLGLFPALFIALVAETARAEDAGHSGAWKQASKLHEEAEHALKKGDWGHACRLYEESEALDPSATTQTRVAECLQHDGHLARALEAYKAALPLAERLEPDRKRRIAELIRHRIEALDPRVPKLRIATAPDIDGLVLTLDGRTLSREELDAPFFIDPGNHVITATAPTFAPSRCEIEETEGAAKDAAVVTGSGDVCRLEEGRWIVTLRKLDSDLPAVSAAPTETRRTSERRESRSLVERASTQRDSGQGDSHRTKRVVGWALGGAGIVALGVGAYFGIRTLSLVSDADCDAQNRCSQSGVDTIDRASGTQTAGFVAVGVGAALLTGGIVLELLSRDRSNGEHITTRGITATFTLGGASVAGAW